MSRGPATVAVRLGAWRGERDARVDPALVEAALDGHEGRGERDVLKSDARSMVTAVRTPEGPAVVVKEVRKGGARRRLADLVRGSPGRRGFRAGSRLLALGIGAARPLAFLERRSFWLPTRSLLVSEDLRDAPTADRALAEGAISLDVVVDLVTALHRAGVVHGDLRAQHVHVLAGGETRLIDLEGVRFRGSLGEDVRIEDLAQLNASLADDRVSAAERRRALARYARALPFRAPEEEIARRIHERSLARGHLFSGAACSGAACAAAATGGP